jgi:alpha-glucosidase
MAISPSAAAAAPRSLEPIELVSPDGKLAAQFLLESEEADSLSGRPRCRVSRRGSGSTLTASFGFELADGAVLGEDCTIEKASRGEFNETYRQHPGKRSKVLNRASTLELTLREKTGQRWKLAARVYDDAVAWRYEFLRQEASDGDDAAPELVLARELTSFELPAATESWALPLDGHATSFEGRYFHGPIEQLPTDKVLAMPLLVRLPAGPWMALTEANLTEYAGMSLARNSQSPCTLKCSLSPLPDEPGVAVRAPLPHHSPWRVVQVADRVERFVESDVLLNLNEPCSMADTSWIVPAKTTFPWWNGYYEEGVPFTVGLNTETVEHYIDFCSEAGIGCHSLDGDHSTAWYGGPIFPYEGADITQTRPDLDMPEVLSRARSKGVKLRLWMHWQAAQKHMARAFPVYCDWGVEGVMIDFMDRDDQLMNRFLREVLQTAADNRLTVTFHGVSKPTGLERTFPNLLASEGVLNLEYDKWDDQGIPPEHETTVVFTRMLAGPMDFHQGSLRAVRIEAFKPRVEAPLVIGTPCRTLASYVVYLNHMPMVADYPSAYRGHPGLPVLASIPATWDETAGLPSEVGSLAAIARRHGDVWWVGVMNGRQEREIELPLNFLPAGRHRGEAYLDDLSAEHELRREERAFDSNEPLKLSLAPSGGALLRIQLAAPSSPQ